METVPNTFAGMFWGYLAIWAIIVGYLISLVIRVSRLEKKNRKDS